MARKWAKKMVALGEIHPDSDEAQRREGAKTSRLVRIKKKKNKIILWSGSMPLGIIRVSSKEGTQKITLNLKPGASIDFDPDKKILKASIPLDKSAKKS